MKAWLLPISGMHTAYRLHYFDVSGATNVLSRAGCGRSFNPGFARRQEGLKKCATCRRAEARRTS